MILLLGSGYLISSEILNSYDKTNFPNPRSQRDVKDCGNIGVGFVCDPKNILSRSEGMYLRIYVYIRGENDIYPL